MKEEGRGKAASVVVRVMKGYVKEGKKYKKIIPALVRRCCPLPTACRRPLPAWERKMFEYSWFGERLRREPEAQAIQLVVDDCL